MESTFQFVPIDELRESPFNRRKHYDPKRLEELTESVRGKGVLTPLLARPNDGLYEIAAGSRRYRAAKAAGLGELPVVIRPMTDVELIEIITIENLQREDLHPLEEAEGYRALMDRGGYDVATIAAKVGKSESYVYQRLKLSDLIPEGKKAFFEEKITVGHAILIARLQPKDQKDMLDACIDKWRNLSVRELAEHIDSEIHLDLSSASFSKKDPDLIPSAGPCTTCPKRTGFIPMLFPDIKKKDTCTDPSCFKEKVQTYIDSWLKTETPEEEHPRLQLTRNYDGRKKRLSDDFNFKDPIPSNLYEEIGQKKKDRCEHTREGIIVEGHGTGTVLHVCIEPTCKIHRGKYSNDPETAKWKAQQKASTEKKKIEELARLRIVNEVIAKVSGELSRDDLVLVADQFFDELWDEYKKKILSRHEVKPIKEQYTLNTRAPMRKHIDGLSRADLCKLLIEMVLIRNLQAPYQGRGDILLETAKRYQVDAKKIQEMVNQERKKKEKVKAQKTLKLAKKGKAKGKKESMAQLHTSTKEKK